MDKAEAVAERARLQNLLDAYDAGRVAHQGKCEPGELARGITPDRAGNVRARIGRLNQLIAQIEDDQTL